MKQGKKPRCSHLYNRENTFVAGTNHRAEHPSSDLVKPKQKTSDKAVLLSQLNVLTFLKRTSGGSVYVCEKREGVLLYKDESFGFDFLVESHSFIRERE